MAGTVVGYDPGGDRKHGLAWATVRDRNIVNVTTKTLRNVEEVVASIFDIETPLWARYRHAHLLGHWSQRLGVRRIAGFESTIPTCRTASKRQTPFMER